jgi:type III pantothenate kinase
MNLTLLLDVGNSNLKVGLAREDGEIASFVLPTRHDDTADSLGLALTGLVSSAGRSVNNVAAAAACSVAPSMNPVVRRALSRYFDVSPVFLPDDHELPIENRYERPREVGADRLVTAFAAREIFAAPNVIVVDFGTATTFDVVSGNAYLGGLICPGVMSSTRAMSTQTAKLPQISLEIDSPEISVGKSTADSLNQGMVFGFASMVEGLCARLADTLDGDVNVVATGGFAATLAPVCPCLEHVRPDLLLEGLRKAHRMLRV